MSRARAPEDGWITFGCRKKRRAEPRATRGDPGRRGEPGEEACGEQIARTRRVHQNFSIGCRGHTPRCSAAREGITERTTLSRCA